MLIVKRCYWFIYIPLNFICYCWSDNLGGKDWRKNTIDLILPISHKSHLFVKYFVVSPLHVSDVLKGSNVFQLLLVYRAAPKSRSLNPKKPKIEPHSLKSRCLRLRRSHFRRQRRHFCSHSSRLCSSPLCYFHFSDCAVVFLFSI